MSVVEYKVSNHAKERYAERIMDKERKIDIKSFVAMHDEKINTDINKMIHYGQLIYSGRQISNNFGNQEVNIFLKDNWVVIIDPVKLTVITLYAIDLGVGSEMNKMYVDRMLGKLNVAKYNMREAQEKANEQIDTYKGIIADNEAMINEYRKAIKCLEQQNDGYKEVIEGLQANVNFADEEVRNVVAMMIGRKVF